MARELSLFTREGIDLQSSQVPNSTQQLQQLMDLETGIVTTAADNLVYWNEDRGADFLIFMVGAGRLDQNFYVRPEIQTYDDLRGGVLAVDSASSGYATVLRAILARNGLSVGQDVRFEEVGNTGARTEALVDGRVVGSMLGEGQVSFIAQAEAAGVHVLARGADYMPVYPSGTYATTRRWAADNPQLMVGFVRAVIGARNWLRDPSNADAAVAMAARVYTLNENQARAQYRSAVDELGAPTIDAQVRTDMLQAIADMRVETGLLEPPAPSASKYVTPNWYQLAQQSMSR